MMITSAKPSNSISTIRVREESRRAGSATSVRSPRVVSAITPEMSSSSAYSGRRSFFTAVRVSTARAIATAATANTVPGEVAVSSRPVAIAATRKPPFSIALWLTLLAESSCGRAGQDREHRRLGRGVAAGGDREQRREDEDDVDRGIEARRHRRAGEDDRHRQAAEQQHRAPREAVGDHPGERRGQRPGQQPDQRHEADAGDAVRLEAVDPEGDREAPAGEGDPDPGDPEQAEIAILEIDQEGSDDDVQLPCGFLHRPRQDSRLRPTLGTG